MYNKIIQKISLAIWNSKISVKLWGIFRIKTRSPFNNPLFLNFIEEMPETWGRGLNKTELNSL